jgi:hypothetical protein
VNNNIERLLYYDREYLRSFDLTAEQIYHMDMRRRLNVALHLWGIVDGLDVKKGALVPGAPEQFYVDSGMAIDGYGREIILFAPYVLSDDDLRANQIHAPGTYPLGIAYSREPTTPPEGGYRVCDLKDQYTRLRESYRITISNDPGPGPLSLTGVTDALSDDPKKAPWLVRLGSVVVVPSASGLTIQEASPSNRVYLGLRAQRIVAPVASLAPDSPDATLPISVEEDLLVKQNLMVGNDFPIDTSKVSPPPDHNKFPDLTKFPGTAGNLKTANVFVLDDLYKSVGGQWLALQQYIQSLIPEIQTGPPIIITPGAGESNSTFPFSLTSKLPEVTSASMVAALNGVEWQGKKDLTDWWNALAPADGPSINVNVDKITKKAGTANVFDFSIAWSVGPPTGLPKQVSVKSLQVVYSAIFYP